MQAKVLLAPPMQTMDPILHLHSKVFLQSEQEQGEDHKTFTNLKKAPLREGPNDAILSNIIIRSDSHKHSHGTTVGHMEQPTFLRQPVNAQWSTGYLV